MKYCSHCGAEVNDEAVVCIKCGCSVSNSTNQVVGIVNPNDAPSKGFAVLGFFFPIVGFILWLVWNNISPKKAKSCGIGALIGVIGVPLTVIGIIAILLFITSSSVIAYNIKNKSDKQQSVVSDLSSPYIVIKPLYSWYTDIGTVTTKTKDDHSVSVVMNIGYDKTDETAYSVFSGRKFELQDFVRSFFSSKYADDLKPENEERLKQEIKEMLNKRFLENEIVRVRDITFTKFDVMVAF